MCCKNQQKQATTQICVEAVLLPKSTTEESASHHLKIDFKIFQCFYIFCHFWQTSFEKSQPFPCTDFNENQINHYIKMRSRSQRSRFFKLIFKTQSQNQKCAPKINKNSQRHRFARSHFFRHLCHSTIVGVVVRSTLFFSLSPKSNAKI